MEHPFATLTNAALAWVALRQASLTGVPSRTTAEDRISIEQEQMAITTETVDLLRLWESVMAIAEMRYPSVEQLLRHRGYRYEADRIAELVQLVTQLQPEK